MALRVRKPLVTTAIYLLGYDLDPAHITQVLGVEPSSSQIKGGFKPGSARHIARTGMWTIMIESDSRSASEMVDELLQRLENSGRRLDRIKGVQNAHLDVLFALDDGEGSKQTIEFKLTRTQMSKLSQLGLGACITVM